MATSTSSYSFSKPTIGGDEDAWGASLNANWDQIDDLLDGSSPITGIDIDGGTMDGVTLGAASAVAITASTLTVTYGEVETDADAATVGSFFNIADLSAASNVPSAFSSGPATGIFPAQNAANGMQILAFLNNNGRLARRRLRSGSFGTWHTILDSEIMHTSAEVTVADDAAGTITPPRNGGMAAITYNGDSETPQSAFSALIWYDVGSTGEGVVKVSSGIGGSVTAQSSGGVLTGTTGTNGVVTVSASANLIYIENRSGNSAEFRVDWLGAGEP